MNICLRCGHNWYPRGNWRTGNHTAVRCASCRSKYWNKPYVRDYSKTGLLNAKSSFDLKLLPSHSAGVLSRKQLEIPADKYMRVNGAKLASPGVVRSKPSPALSKISGAGSLHKRTVDGTTHRVLSGTGKISTRVKKPARVVAAKGLKHKKRKLNATKSKSGL